MASGAPDIQGMGIRVLGPLSLDGDGAIGRRDRVVMSALVLERGRAVSAELLAEVLWPEGPPATAAKAVQGCIVRLRAKLGPDSIRTTAQGYVLDGHGTDVDVARFEESVARARELAAVGQHDRAAYLLGEALDLWTGAPFPDLEHWDTAAIESARLEELRLQAEELLVEAILETGDPAGALARAQPMVAEAPLREHRWVLLALASYRAGRQSDALAALRTCRERLCEELGVDPGAEVAELEQAILQQDPGLLETHRPTTPGTAPVDTCPWPGLNAYGPEEADAFFGREQELVSALAQLRARGVLAVVGPSGIGKSSFVRAGIVPALTREERVAAVLTPGAHPAGRLPGGDLLVVDQCEELFTLCTDSQRRADFVAALERHARAGLLVLALRADRMSDVSEHPGLARLVERGLYLIGGLTETGVRAAIEKPAAQAGLILEPGLVDLLLRDLEGEPGALPLLSYAMVETWVRREGRTLTVEAYQQSGGVRGAVAQAAEQVWERLDPVQRDALRALMLRLVTAGPDGEPLRTRIPRRLVAADPDHQRLLEVLVRSRLITSDDETLTLAHEALGRAWPRLQGWLLDDVDGRRILHHLSTTAEAWDNLGRPVSELYRGVRLARTLEWRDRTPVDLSPTEATFLGASEALRQDEERSAEERARQQARENRRLRVMVVALAVFVGLALVAGLLALRQSRIADHAASAAAAAATAADARRVGSTALQTSDIPTSLLLAVAGARLDPSYVTRANLQAALASHPEIIRTTTPNVDSDIIAAAADNGRHLAVMDKSHLVSQYDVATLRPRGTYRAGRTGNDRSLFSALAYSPDGRTLAVAAPPASELPVLLLGSRSMKPAPRQLGGWPRQPAGVGGVSFDRTGRRLAVSLSFVNRSGVAMYRSESYLLVWDLARPRRPILSRPLRGSFFAGVRLSPDGRTAFTTVPLTAYDVASGQVRWRRAGWNTDPVIAVDRTGRRLAVVDPRGGLDAAVLDSETGQVSQRFTGHTAPIRTVAFSADGTRLATAALDQRAIVWRIADGEAVDTFDLGGNDPRLVSFARHDTTLCTVLADVREVQAWDLAGYRQFITRIRISRPDPLQFGGGMVRSSPDGAVFANARGGGGRVDLRFVDVEHDRTSPWVHTRQTGWYGAGGWHPDGSRFVVGYTDGVLQVVDTRTAKVLAARRVVPGAIYASGYTGDGRDIVVAQQDGEIQLLDAATLTAAGRPVQLPETALDMAVSPKGHLAFVTTGGTQSRPYLSLPSTHWYLVDLDASRVVASGSLGLRNATLAAFTPDGSHVGVGGTGGQFVVVDLASGRSTRPRAATEQGTIFWVTASPDGDRFATGSDAGVVNLWDSTTGALVGTARIPGEQMAVPAFRADGTLNISSQTGRVYRWEPSLTRAIDFACRVAGRDLTTDEWDDAFPGRSWRPTCPR